MISSNNKEIWQTCVNSTFLDIDIYKKDVPEIEKTYFLRMLKGFIDNLLDNNYDNSVSEIEHLSNIKSISRYSTAFSIILKKGKINFGITQMLFNTYLKKMWLNKSIPAPPHFPVNNAIQKKLKLKICSWSKMENETEYLNVIHHAKKELKENNFKAIAELELFTEIVNLAKE